MNTTDNAQALIADAREECLVTTDMVRRAMSLNVPMRLVWCAAGAGLAAYHKRRYGHVLDVKAELGVDAMLLPADYFNGYSLEAVRGDYAEVFPDAGCPSTARRGERSPEA